MKKALKIALLIIAVGVFFAYCSSQFGEHYTEEDEGKTYSIEWEYVNLREKPSQSSDIIDVLHYGDTITLTGYSHENLGGDNLPDESWRKITVDGKTGWIVTDSIQW